MKDCSYNNFLPIIGTLIGVIVGFLLSIVYEIVKNKLSVKRKKRAIRNELNTNLGLIPQKIEHIKSLKKTLERQKILPCQNVHCTTYLYDFYIGDIGIQLTKDERENLHVIYESIRVVDKFLDDVFIQFINFRMSGQISKPFEFYIGMCEELINRCNLVQNLIKEYLDGNLRKITGNKF
ncbi:MAG: hypothetical protein U9O55_02615 [Patescibacteria group bacterium]|nr:hypothetical protein [Patescibacteria group bacterium]